MATQAVANTLNSVLETDPFFARATQGSLAAAPLLVAAGQSPQPAGSPNPQTIALSGLYSQAIGITAALGVVNFVAAFNNLQSYLAANRSLLNPQIQQELNSFVQANAASLSAIGLTADSSGMLSANHTTLDSVAASNPQAVQSALFGSTGLGTIVASLASDITGALQAQLPSPTSGSAILPGSAGVAVNLLA